MSFERSETPGTLGVKREDLEVYSTNYAAHRKGTTLVEAVRVYNDWAKNGCYEQDLCPERYSGPKIAASYMVKYFPDVDVRRDINIMDVAAGTGLLGDTLLKSGFTSIDGLDPAQDMLNIAAKKDIYNKLICDSIGTSETELLQDTYETVVISGGMGEGHIPCSGLFELIRIVKPGGLVIIVMREEYLSYVKEYVGRLEPLMALLEKDGIWQAEERTVVPNYSFGKNGVVYVFKVLVNGTGMGHANNYRDFR